MSDREKVINDLQDAVNDDWMWQHADYYAKAMENAITLLKEQEVVRCKDCVHRGKSEKCVLAAISKEKDFPLFMLDNRGEWFCADGERR